MSNKMKLAFAIMQLGTFFPGSLIADCCPGSCCPPTPALAQPVITPARSDCPGPGCPPDPAPVLHRTTPHGEVALEPEIRNGAKDVQMDSDGPEKKEGAYQKTKGK